MPQTQVAGSTRPSDQLWTSDGAEASGRGLTHEADKLE
jgi:hypothetical protein